MGTKFDKINGGKQLTCVSTSMSASNSTALKRKRRVYKNGCANPLFVKWVEEWRDDARERGVNSHYSYTKALTSLKKYPLPLASGQEAKILDHVGEKLAKMLDKKLAEHNSKQGSEDTSSTFVSPKKKGTPSSSGNTSAAIRSPVKSKIINRKETAEETRSSKDKPSKKNPAKKRPSVSHEYVPVYRSGPYAILVALYKAEEKPSWRGYLNKSQLITEAQPYCDTSFTVADAGSYYTAWSSASSLVAKGFMIRKGHPPKFSLSDTGASLAIRLLQQSEGTRSNSQLDLSVSAHTSTAHSPPLATTSQLHKRKRHSSGSPSRSNLSPAKKHCSSLCLKDNSSSSAMQPPRQCIVLGGDDVDDGDEGGSPSGLNSDVTVAYSMEESEEDTAIGSQSNDPLPILLKELHFWYIDPDGREVCSKDQAAVTINDVVSVGFLIKCDKTLLESSYLTYSIDHTRLPEGPYIFAYLRNEDAPSLSNPPHKGLRTSSIPETLAPRTTSDPPPFIPSPPRDHSASRLNGSAIDPITLTDSDSSDDSEPEVIPLLNRIGLGSNMASIKSSQVACSSSVASFTAASSSIVSPTPSQAAGSSVASLTPSQVAGAAAIRRLTVLESKIKYSGQPVNLDGDVNADGEKSALTRQRKRRPAGSCKDGRGELQEAPSSSADASNSFRTLSRSQTSHQSTTCTGEQTTVLGTPEFTLLPGEFEVVLCVDNSESTASRKSSTQFRGILLADLGKNGVAFDVRRLNVGDFTWIAREKASPLPGQLGLPISREVVLEHIVERKRIDDLAGSIMDGRFAEQKFRLHNCGVRHPIYLIEEYGDSAHLKMPLRSLVQAVANTQVIDGFHIKTTTDIRESVAYLTIMTRALQKQYANKTIKAYSPDKISELNQKNLSRQGVDKNTVYSMPFKQFNEASIKNKVLTVYEMFGRHLFQLPGLSADKAAAVLERYPTPAHLREAYSKCSSESERESLLSDIRAGQCKRRLGIASSRLVCAIYWSGKE